MVIYHVEGIGLLISRVTSASIQLPDSGKFQCYYIGVLSVVEAANCCCTLVVDAALWNSCVYVIRFLWSIWCFNRETSLFYWCI